MDRAKIEAAVRLFLEGIGDDVNRPGLRETPERVAHMCESIFSGIGVDSASLVKVLQGENHDEIVLIRDIPFYSVCEHHLLPFIGHAHVAYVPHQNRITGISKLARVVATESRKPQIQERLTSEIADSIVRALRPKGVMVVIEAEHLCMTMRGVKAPGARTVTSVVRGLFRDNPATRAETLSLIGRRKEP